MLFAQLAILPRELAPQQAQGKCQVKPLGPGTTGNGSLKIKLHVLHKAQQLYPHCIARSAGNGSVKALSVTLWRYWKC